MPVIRCGRVDRACSRRFARSAGDKVRPGGCGARCIDTAPFQCIFSALAGLNAAGAFGTRAAHLSDMKTSPFTGAASLLRACVVALSLGAPVVGCNGSTLYAPGPPAPEEVTVRVYGDPDEPVVGAEIGSGAGVLGRTDATGTTRFKLDGADGSRFDLSLSCPEGFGSQTRSLKVILRRGSRAPEYTASCRRTTRTVVVAVRAPGAPRIAVMNLGQELGRLDDAGHALVHVDAKVGETIALTLDTSDPKYKALRPQNPELRFAVTNADELYTFEQKFTEEKPVIRRVAPPRPHVPTLLH